MPGVVAAAAVAAVAAAAVAAAANASAARQAPPHAIHVSVIRQKALTWALGAPIKALTGAPGAPQCL